jgi:hypothetical protein
VSDERQQLPEDIKRLYQSLVDQKTQGGVNDQINQIIAGQMAELKDSGGVSVVYEPWKETYYKVEGGWKGPGGFFGSLTLLAKELDAQLASKSTNTDQTEK